MISEILISIEVSSKVKRTKREKNKRRWIDLIQKQRERRKSIK